MAKTRKARNRKRYELSEYGKMGCINLTKIDANMVTPIYYYHLGSYSSNCEIDR